MQLQPRPGRSRTPLLAAALIGLLLLAPTSAGADTSPAPAPTSTPSTGSASPLPEAQPEAVTPSPATPSPSPTPSPTPPGPEAPARAEAGHATAEEVDADSTVVTLKVRSSGSPVAGRFFQDVGRYALVGTATELPADSSVAVYRRPALATAWTRVATAPVVDGAYAASLPVTSMGDFVFVATTGGAPGSGDEVSSLPVEVHVADSVTRLDKPAARVDALKKPALTGSVVPARAGVAVDVEVLVGSTWRRTTTATTNATGRFRVAFGHGVGKLARYTLRAKHRAPNRDRWEISGSRTLARTAVLNAVVTPTTAAEVATTYRKGCPVGRSKLSTITMNYYGRDRTMHRGVLIIRTDLVPEIKRSFGKGLAARFPIAKMENPNAYGGNDPKQMEANNTSGFNCRKVVGNPYAQSPHSYGTAIDITPVQNPYRDSTGKWWPSNGKPYIDRTPLRFGMLGEKSPVTKQLRSDRFFWGGLWNPGRDYQHFEYRG